MAKQHGNSDMGVSSLDRANENLGISEEQQASQRTASPLASGGDEASQSAGSSVIGEGEKIGAWSEDGGEDGALLASDEDVGSWSESGGSGMSASGDQPGGNEPSESERPDTPDSRWGGGRGGSGR